MYFERGSGSLKTNSYRLDDRMSNQYRVDISDSIYRPVGNCSPYGTVQGALLKDDNFLSANEEVKTLRRFISAAPCYFVVRRVSPATHVPLPALLVC